MSADEEVPIVVTAVEIVDGRRVPIGEPRETTISRGALNLLHGNDALTDRRQRAHEAFWDGATPVGTRENVDSLNAAAEAAIETAIRAQITPEIIEAARAGYAAADGGWTEDPGPRETARLVAAFRAAGFEVEE